MKISCTSIFASLLILSSGHVLGSSLAPVKLSCYQNEKPIFIFDIDIDNKTIIETILVDGKALGTGKGLEYEIFSIDDSTIVASMKINVGGMGRMIHLNRYSLELFMTKTDDFLSTPTDKPVRGQIYNCKKHERAL